MVREDVPLLDSDSFGSPCTLNRVVVLFEAVSAKGYKSGIWEMYSFF
jgi:hypothetical protein